MTPETTETTHQNERSEDSKEAILSSETLHAATARPSNANILFGSLAVAVSLVGAYLIGRGTAAVPHSSDTVTESGTTTTTAADASAAPIQLTPNAEKTAGVNVASAHYAAVAGSLTVPGTVEVSPNRGARITPPVAGKIISLFAAPGDPVRSGARLVVLDSPEVAQAHAAVREAQTRIAEAQAQVQTAQAGVEQAQTRLGSARAALQRQRDLAQTGAISQPSLQAAQNELNTAQAELSQAQTDVQAQTTIVARNQRLFDAQIVAKAELEQSQVAQQQARTRVTQSEKRVALAQQALDREQRVFRGGLLNRQAVQTAEADVRAAEGDLRQARKQEEAARTSLSGTRTGLAAAQANLHAVEGDGHSEGGAGRISLFAPLGGTIATRGASVGQAVERSSELFTIQNLDTVLVEASVPEASAARVRVGAPVTVTVAAYPNARFTGVVQSIGSQVDEKTRALPVRCLVQNRNGALKPEMFARVSLSTGNARRALTIPSASVDEDGAERYVYVRTGEGTYEKRRVTLGQTAGKNSEVLSGVKEGESVVTDGLFVLKSESKKDELKGDED